MFSITYFTDRTNQTGIKNEFNLQKKNIDMIFTIHFFSVQVIISNISRAFKIKTNIF